jgi:hypothetical protein
MSLALCVARQIRDAIMENMPSVPNQMTPASSAPILGKGVHKKSGQPSADDMGVPAYGAFSPDLFQQLLQSSLQDRDHGEQCDSSQSIHDRVEDVDNGKVEPSQIGGEKSALAPAGISSHTGSDACPNPGQDVRSPSVSGTAVDAASEHPSSLSSHKTAETSRLSGSRGEMKNGSRDAGLDDVQNTAGDVHGHDAGVGEKTDRRADGLSVRSSLEESADVYAGSSQHPESGRKKETHEHTDDASARSLLKNGPEGRLRRAANGDKVSSPLSNPAVPDAVAAPMSMRSEEGEREFSAVHGQSISAKAHLHPRSDRRPAAGHAGGADEKEGSQGTAVAGATAGDAEAVLAADVGDFAGLAHNLERIHHRTVNKYAEGDSPFAPLEEAPGEHVRQVARQAKSASLPSDLAIPAMDGAQTLITSSEGEGIVAPGRQSILAQVIENARTMMHQGGGRVLISLSPPSLGALDIDVRVTKGGIELYMVANSSDVQQTLCSHIEQLRSALGDQGLNMDRFQVVVGDRSDSQPGHDPRQKGMGDGQWEAGDGRGFLLRGDGETRDDEVRKATVTRPYPSVGAINLFI